MQIVEVEFKNKYVFISNLLFQVAQQLLQGETKTIHPAQNARHYQEICVDFQVILRICVLNLVTEFANYHAMNAKKSQSIFVRALNLLMPVLPVENKFARRAKAMRMVQGTCPACSQCQTLVEETCKYHRSEFKRRCVSGRKYFCHMSCNKCKKLTDFLCIFWSPRQLYYLADSAKTCIAKAEQYCLNTIDKSKGNSKSNGEGKSDENSKSNASSKSNEEGKGDEKSNVNSKSNNDDLQIDEKNKGNEYHNGK